MLRLFFNAIIIILRVKGSRVTMLPLCACLLAPTMKSPCSIEQFLLKQWQNQQKVIIKCENQNHISIIQSNPLSQPKFLQPKQKPKYQQTKLNQY